MHKSRHEDIPGLDEFDLCNLDMPRPCTALVEAHVDVPQVRAPRKDCGPHADGVVEVDPAKCEANRYVLHFVNRESPSGSPRN